jgi:D-arabinose 1-dehydrogenase-like Zn-dependent alcohol dehydrogenase
MKAARLEDGQLHIRDLPVPEPGFEEARIRISASGVCHSDLHIVRGDWAGVPLSGNIGHEAIGVVEALGPGADRFANVGAAEQVAATGAARASTASPASHVTARSRRASSAPSPNSSASGRARSS